MEIVKIKTGIHIPDEPSLNIKTFLLVFSAIIWRRVWITAAIYCEHNNMKLDKPTVLKSLKFNVFSEFGIGSVIRPYIVKSLTDGFMMPQFYEQNFYATRAVKLFKPAFEIIKANDRDKEIKFIQDYSMCIFDINENKAEETANEIRDLVEELEQSEQSERSKGSERIEDKSGDGIEGNGLESDNKKLFVLLGSRKKDCVCRMCELVNSWDIESGLIYTEDQFQKIVYKGLITTLEIMAFDQILS